MKREIVKDLDKLEGKNVLLVASTGGHLAQIVRWRAKLDIAKSSSYVTFRSPQSESLLAGENVIFVPYMAPRDWRNAIRAAKAIWHADPSVDAVLSTGAGLALAAVPFALRRKLPFIFIDSVSRFDGPSLTGRIMVRLPSVRTFTQHREWMSQRWRYSGSVLDTFHFISTGALKDRPLKIFVTVGTIRPYRFDALVDSVLKCVTAEDQIFWQLGETIRTNLPGTTATYISSQEFDDRATASDVVITHAGVGSLLRILELGIRPLVVPRASSRGEHVDDHQAQAAREFTRRDLAVTSTPQDLSRQLMLQTPGNIRGQ